MIKWISRGNPTEAARMLLQREDIVATNEEDLLKITPCQKVLVDKIFEKHKIDGKCYGRLPVRVGKEIVFVKQRSTDLIENATEINCEETDQRKMTLHKAVRMNEDEKVENEDLTAFDGSPLTNWEKEKLDMAIAMITRRQVRKRDERKSAQGKEKGIIDELRNGAKRVLNEIEREVDVAREQI
ncbi:unnamed protein product [Toxocara canis]|uniref:PDZ domain-containing protein n=1 Tax=Toxocara canis TaxID=6265 RepID=A0A183VHH6_TOXCA|nr:unnamed protein product [Toxocara canis]